MHREGTALAVQGAARSCATDELKRSAPRLEAPAACPRGAPRKELCLMRMKLVPLLAIILLAAVPLWAQTVPTGTISGKVVDSDGLATPGVTVTAESPALQGSRTVNSSANGDYIIPFLPAGDYTVTFTLTGFKTVKQTARVSPSESVSVNPTMTVSTVSETITVVGQTNSEFGQSAEVATNFKSDLMDKLP